MNLIDIIQNESQKLFHKQILVRLSWETQRLRANKRIFYEWKFSGNEIFATLNDHFRWRFHRLRSVICPRHADANAKPFSSPTDPNNRVAPSEPPTHRNDGRGYVITPQRLQQIRSNFMYWFFDQGGPENQGDLQRDIHASNQQVHKNFNFQLPFFGFRFNYTRVSRSMTHSVHS